MRKAVFLDRDGVVISDIHLLTSVDQLHVVAGVSAALKALAEAGFRLVVVTNQPVVARGLVTESDVEAVHTKLAGLIVATGGPVLDRFYFCPHHPNATLPAYRVDCDCRKPKPGMFLRAARDLGIELTTSFAVGDRLTDIIAGARAGCRTVLVQTGKHLDNPIQTSELLDATIQPDYTCPDLAAAAEWILTQCKIKNAK